MMTQTGANGFPAAFGKAESRCTTATDEGPGAVCLIKIGPDGQTGYL
jgi:hypothetical protein